MKFFPSNERDWQEGLKVLPEAEIEENLVTVKNIRDFEYRTETDFTVRYYDQTFDLAKIKKVYFMVVPFNSFSLVAHQMIAFEFEDNHFICFSVEVRKTVGVEFSPWKTLLPKYELIYVIGSENDLIKLRTDYRTGEHVYFYPLELNQAETQNIFLDLLNRANALRNRPEFFHLLYNSCGSNLVTHLNKALERKIPWYLKYYAPGKADAFLLGNPLVNQEPGLTYEEFRARHYLNDKTKSFPPDGNFSLLIRNK